MRNLGNCCRGSWVIVVAVAGDSLTHARLTSWVTVNSAEVIIDMSLVEISIKHVSIDSHESGEYPAYALGGSSWMAAAKVSSCLILSSV